MSPIDRLWSLAAGVLAVGLGLAAWFGIISPELSAASKAQDELENVESLNQVHELRILALEQDMERIGELRAMRDALAEGIPGEALYSDFLREVDRMASASSVTIEGITSGDAVAYVPPTLEEPAEEAPAEEAPAEGDGDQQVSASDSSTAAVAGEEPAADAAANDGGAAAAPAPLVDPRIDSDNFAAVPFTISASGDTTALAGFLQRLQGGSRIVSITTASVSEGTEASEGDGGAAAEGSAQITGFLYVLQTAMTAPEPTP